MRTLLAALVLSWGGVSHAASKLIPIRIAYPSGMNGQIPVVMQHAGIGKKHGLDATYTFFQYGPPMIRGLVSGQVDAVITSLMPVTTLLSRLPNSAVIVASLGHSSMALVVPKDSTITDVKQLKGEKIAVSFGSDSELDLLTFLKASSLNPKSDVQLVNTPPNQLVEALRQKLVAAAVIRQPLLLQVERDYGFKVVHNWPFHFISIMSPKFVKSHPGVQQKYVAAIRDSILYIAKHKKQSSVWFGKRLRLDPKTIREVSEDDPYYHVTSLADIHVGLTPSFVDLLHTWFKESYSNGMIKTPVHFTQVTS